MPIDYTIDRERKLVHTRAWGILTAEEFLAYQDRLRDNPDFRPSFDQLAIFSEVTQMLIPPGAAEQIATAAPFAKGFRRAAVATTDFVFGMGRMYEAYSPEGSQITIFRTLEEARAWLEL